MCLATLVVLLGSRFISEDISGHRETDYCVVLIG